MSKIDTSLEAVETLAVRLTTAHFEIWPSTAGYTRITYSDVIPEAAGALRELRAQLTAETARADRMEKLVVSGNEFASQIGLELIDAKAQLTAATDKLASARDRELQLIEYTISEYRKTHDGLLNTDASDVLFNFNTKESQS